MESLQKMLTTDPEFDAQKDLFRPLLVDIIDLNHRLVQLAKSVDWRGLQMDLSPYYCENNGAPGKSIPLMAGLCFLKDISGLSDEELCRTWQENPYYQYFCGEEYFCHELPVQQPTIGNFRRRIGEDGLERLLDLLRKS